MTIGKKLYELRKQAGLSQETLAEKLQVSRQTVSKWENDLSSPDLTKANALCELYEISYETLFQNKSQHAYIDTQLSYDDIDWTSAWSKKYPILAQYQQQVDIKSYKQRIETLFDDFQMEYHMNETDTILILKDLLYHIYLDRKKAESMPSNQR